MEQHALLADFEENVTKGGNALNENDTIEVLSKKSIGSGSSLWKHNVRKRGKEDILNASENQSPTRLLSYCLVDTYRKCSNLFMYAPRRCLTKPSLAVFNNGVDNENSDYILFVSDIIGSEKGRRYRVLDNLGMGTFGQVVKCQNLDTREMFAVKVVKNKSAYYNQALVEVNILQMIQKSYDVDDVKILRIFDAFVFRNHLCIVCELMNLNLYELLKQNGYRGLSLKLIHFFLAQIMKALTALYDLGIIHCDVKPENILLADLSSPKIKLVDFGSACFEDHTVYSYLQSRFYRSPEVLVGLPYGPEIDMWSLGCIAAELYLGLPLFPGTNEHDQLRRIIEMRGPFPVDLLKKGKSTKKFFVSSTNGEYELKSLRQYCEETRAKPHVGKTYFGYKSLDDIIKFYPYKKGMSQEQIQNEKHDRLSFADFLLGLLQIDPRLRWTPVQASQHPFMTRMPFLEPYTPSIRRTKDSVWSRSVEKIQSPLIGSFDVLSGSKNLAIEPQSLECNSVDLFSSASSSSMFAHWDPFGSDTVSDRGFSRENTTNLDGLNLVPKRSEEPFEIAHCPEAGDREACTNMNIQKFDQQTQPTERFPWLSPPSNRLFLTSPKQRGRGERSMSTKHSRDIDMVVTSVGNTNLLFDQGQSSCDDTNLNEQLPLSQNSVGLISSWYPEDTATANSHYADMNGGRRVTLPASREFLTKQRASFPDRNGYTLIRNDSDELNGNGNDNTQESEERNRLVGSENGRGLPL